MQYPSSPDAGRATYAEPRALWTENSAAPSAGRDAFPAVVPAVPSDYDAPGFAKAPPNTNGIPPVSYLPAAAYCLECGAIARRGESFRYVLIEPAARSNFKIRPAQYSYRCGRCAVGYPDAGDSATETVHSWETWWFQRE